MILIDYEISVHETPWVKGHIYHIVLYDTTDEDDLVINNVLIESGLATPINNNGMCRQEYMNMDRYIVICM